MGFCHFKPSTGYVELKGKGRKGKHTGEHSAGVVPHFLKGALTNNLQHQQLPGFASSQFRRKVPEASLLYGPSLAHAGRAPTLSRTPLGQRGPDHRPPPYQSVAFWSQVHPVPSSPSRPTPTQERVSPPTPGAQHSHVALGTEGRPAHRPPQRAAPRGRPSPATWPTTRRGPARQPDTNLPNPPNRRAEQPGSRRAGPGRERAQGSLGLTRPAAALCRHPVPCRRPAPCLRRAWEPSLTRPLATDHKGGGREGPRAAAAVSAGVPAAAPLSAWSSVPLRLSGHSGHSGHSGTREPQPSGLGRRRSARGGKPGSGPARPRAEQLAQGTGRG